MLGWSARADAGGGCLREDRASSGVTCEPYTAPSKYRHFQGPILEHIKSPGSYSGNSLWKGGATEVNNLNSGDVGEPPLFL